MGWQLLTHYHCKIGLGELNDAPGSTMYLAIQPLAERRRDGLLWQEVCIPF
jgi:hypothetical protein